MESFALTRRVDYIAVLEQQGSVESSMVIKKDIYSQPCLCALEFDTDVTLYVVECVDSYEFWPLSDISSA